MKKQPTPVQGYDTQIPSARSARRPGTRSKAKKPDASPNTSSSENNGSEAREQRPISDIKSSLFTSDTINGGDVR